MPVRTATDPLGPTECSELTLRSLFRVLQIFHLFLSPAGAREARGTLQILVDGADDRP